MAIQATDTKKPDPKAETGLITIEEAQIPALFETPGALQPLVVKVREIVEAFVPDVTTKEGREEIASLAYQIAKAKNFADGLGAAHKKKLTEIPKIIDANRSKFWDDLEALQKQARKPLTDWEAEETRLHELEKMLDGRPESFMSFTVEAFTDYIREAEEESLDTTHSEWAPVLKKAKEARILDLIFLRTQREKFDADQAELAELRKQKEEADRLKAQQEADAAEAKRQEDLKAKADEEARMKAQADIDAANRRAEEDRQATERAQADAAAAEQRRLDEAAKAEADRIQAEKDAKAREEKAREQAAAQERARAEKEAADKKAAEEKRMQDLEHRRRILHQIASDILDHAAMDEKEAEILAEALAAGSIRHTSVQF